jgi:hypothetical protein
MPTCSAGSANIPPTRPINAILRAYMKAQNAG